MSLLHCSQSRRAIIASTVGTTVEWYDFLLYGIVTGLVFGKLFFPESDPLVGGRVARRADCDRASRLDWIGLRHCSFTIAVTAIVSMIATDLIEQRARRNEGHGHGAASPYFRHSFGWISQPGAAQVVASSGGLGKEDSGS